MRETKKNKIRLVNAWLSLFHRNTASSEEKAAQLSCREFRSILVYSTTALGDYMFNTPALRAIRRRYPDARITLVAHPKYAQLLKEREFYDDVVFWNNKIGTLARVIREAKAFSPELAIMLHSHIPYAILSAAMAGCRSELPGVISSMDMLVTGDTGPLHLAIALKVPTLSLFVTESPENSGPYQDRHLHRCIYLPATDPRVTDNDVPLKAISVTTVFAGLSEMKISLSLPQP